MKAIQIEPFGNPADVVNVVNVVDVPDVGAPAAGEVVVAIEALPINKYLGPSRRRLRFGPGQGSDHERGTGRWEVAVHAENAIRRVQRSEKVTQIPA